MTKEISEDKISNHSLNDILAQLLSAIERMISISENPQQVVIDAKSAISEAFETVATIKQTDQTKI